MTIKKEQTGEIEVWELRQNGELKFTGSNNECYFKLQRLQGQSAHHAMKYEGWTIDLKED